MKYYKTKCNQCQGKIEFPAHGLGELIACPHCGEDTMLKRKRARRIVGALVVGAASMIALSALLSEHSEGIRKEAADQTRKEMEQQQAIRQHLEIQFELAAQRLDAIKSRRDTRGQFFRDLIPSGRNDPAQQVVEEMRRANDIAEQALFSQQLDRIKVPPLLHSFDEFQQQQSLENIRSELQHIRTEQEFDNFYWRTQPYFRRYCLRSWPWPLLDSGNVGCLFCSS